MRSNIIELEGYMKTETDGAILFSSEINECFVWIPKSLIEIDDSLYESDKIYDYKRVTILIPENIALEKELI